MVIEMVLSQVGEYSDIEMNAIDAPLVDADRRHLHGAGDRLLVNEARQCSLQAHRIGRGIDAWVQLAGKARAQRADDGTLAAKGRHHLGNPLRYRSLAIGAGDSGQPQLVRWPAKDQMRDLAG